MVLPLHGTFFIRPFEGGNFQFAVARIPGRRSIRANPARAANLAGCEGAKVWHLRHEGVGRDRPNAWSGVQKGCPILNVLGRGNASRGGHLKTRDLALQDPQDTHDRGAHAFVECLADIHILALGGFDRLAAAQLQGFWVAYLLCVWRAFCQSSLMAISRITPASPWSVLANRPRLVAKARARRGLMRIAGTPAVASAARSGASHPPDASNATRPPCCRMLSV